MPSLIHSEGDIFGKSDFCNTGRYSDILTSLNSREELVCQPPRRKIDWISVGFSVVEKSIRHSANGPPVWEKVLFINCVPEIIAPPVEFPETKNESA